MYFKQNAYLLYLIAGGICVIPGPPVGETTIAIFQSIIRSIKNK